MPFTYPGMPSRRLALALSLVFSRYNAANRVSRFNSSIPVRSRFCEQLQLDDLL
ncbi:hypothetical protein CY34DRAFT_801661 [Suillus luteus UH-Slu-Lm8-n1]|uniref:Unplaced genomic scaffold CY34scaffold_42, whole genome shotgun sequence n=1 Tax=Suillus luteus UH-Slu-Lm8-n1 TaxID=930992 RepID=A0A0D0A5Q4_9AGAM|nr:hypothetical protein CY34DRAFT_801661 [Suillus luteus UH-Slu-Lm8-n1]